MDRANKVRICQYLCLCLLVCSCCHYGSRQQGAYLSVADPVSVCVLSLCAVPVSIHLSILLRLHVSCCARVCERACMGVCMRACVRVCVHACVGGWV